MNQLIFHLASATDAQNLAKKGVYRTASLDSEGFIHCCTAEQLPGVVQRYYAEAQELTVLTIDPDALEARLVFENTVGGEELFPHVYGEINQQAVRSDEVIGRQRILELAGSA